MQVLAAAAGILLVFIHFSNITELAYTITGTNLRLMYVVAPFAYIGLLFTGGLGRTLQSRWAALYLLCGIWMILATPFSFWPGGSVNVLKSYLMVGLPMVFVTAGLIVTWKQVKLAFYGIAMAAVITVVNVAMFGVSASGDRMELGSSGMLGNSNDIASHLVVVLPFLLLVVIDRNRNFLLRLASVAFMGYGLFQILQTGSRGALVAIAAAAALVLWKATMRMRTGFLAAGLVLSLLLPVALPDGVKHRLMSIFEEDHAEAAESKEARRYLFWQSVRFTFEKPVFGVGPGQFGNYEGRAAQAAGERGNWHATHCSWTQVSSENGIPALIFLVVSLGGMMRVVNRIYRRARVVGNEDVARVCFSFLLALVPYLVSITFLSNSYRFYLPTLIGLGVAMAIAAQKELDRTASSADGSELPPPAPHRAAALLSST